jgi:DNA-binding response OmpR family regulator
MSSVDEKTPLPEKLPARFFKTCNILVIEDDRDCALTICAVLKREGYSVRAVDSRDAALEILQSYLYDVIIMDLFMPGLGPKEFIKEARERHRRSEIILLTATENLKHGAQDLGLCHWLGKPFQPQDLLNVVASCRYRV